MALTGVVATLLAVVCYSQPASAKLTEAQVRVIAEAVGPKYGIEPALLVAMAKVESGFNERAIGRSHGEVGLMQLRPNFFPGASFDPKVNMEMAAKHLSRLKKQCSGMGKAYFVCYNVGANRNLAYPRKTKYYKKVSYALTEYRKASPRRVVSSAN